MRKGNIILGIGIALVLIPILGFPPEWKSFFTAILGLWLCGLAVSLSWSGRLEVESAEQKNESGVSAASTAEAADKATTHYVSESQTNPNAHEQVPTA